MSLASVTGILAIVITMGIFATILMLVIRAKPRKEVLFLRPRDRRGERIPITRETSTSAWCEKHNPIARFIKLGPGYVFTEGGKAVTRFWGIEGTAYTALVEEGRELKLSVKEYLQALWGDKFYDKIPKEQKEAIESDVVGITVEPKPVEERFDVPPRSEEFLNDEDDAVILTRIAKAQQQSVKREFYQMLIGIALGFGFAAILLRLGLFGQG